MQCFGKNLIPLYLQARDDLANKNAPTEDQHSPTNKAVKIKDINYLLIHGANDQDVTAMEGEKQFKNITFSPTNSLNKQDFTEATIKHFKSNLYITVQISKASFAQTQDFDFSAVTKLTISFPEMEKGNIQIDEVGFSAGEFLPSI